jgi:hypothetical protein
MKNKIFIWLLLLAYAGANALAIIKLIHTIPSSHSVTHVILAHVLMAGGGVMTSLMATNPEIWKTKRLQGVFYAFISLVSLLLPLWIYMHY